jgi:hypothetical protein
MSVQYLKFLVLKLCMILKRFEFKKCSAEKLVLILKMFHEN